MSESESKERSLAAGYRLLEYEILSELGNGGFGITYLARDLNLHREVVIKENLPTFAFRDTGTSRVYPNSKRGEDADLFEWSLDSFIAEARTLARFDHPNIVRILRVFEANGTAYFVMPRIEGRPFDEVIEERKAADKPFSEVELREIVDPLLDALEILHRDGFHHRDLKPANLLVSENGPVLIDFGAARQQISEKTQTVVESAGYTAFEQMQTKGKVGPWSDLYGLGAVLYRALTFETPPKAFDRIGNDPIRLLAEDEGLSTRYSPGFLESIDRCLSFEAESRPQSVGELRKLLQGDGATSFAENPPAQSENERRFRKDETGTERLGTEDSSEDAGPVGKKNRRNRIAAAFGLAIIAGVATWLTVASNPNLSITSDSHGAKVFIGGAYAGEPPLDLNLPAGSHVIEARFDPWPAQQKEVRLESGKLTSLAFEFETVSVLLESDPPGAEVREAGGGKILGKTPLELSDLEPGKAAWELSLEGYYSAQHQTELTPGENESISLALSPLIEGTEAGEERTFGGIEMVWCPPGTFLMGSPESEEERDDDETQHEVTLTSGFWLAKHECTQGQWEKVMKNYRISFSGSANLPVTRVSWEDVQEWLAKMNEEHSPDGSWEWALPTEAQWEYACRAGTESPFHFGETLNSLQANFDGNYPYGGAATGPNPGEPVEVGSYQPNAWNSHDMHGNVWEWCRDWHGNYSNGVATDPMGPITGLNRVLRGGSWSSLARSCRAASRDRHSPGYRLSNVGFRPAIVPLQ